MSQKGEKEEQKMTWEGSSNPDEEERHALHCNWSGERNDDDCGYGCDDAGERNDDERHEDESDPHSSTRLVEILVVDDRDSIAEKKSVLDFDSKRREDMKLE